MMGHLIRHVHNRDLAVENIHTAYVRMRLLLASPAGLLDNILERIRQDKELGLVLPKRSVLGLHRDAEFQSKISGAKGTYGIHVRRTRRGGKLLSLEGTSRFEVIGFQER